LADYEAKRDFATTPEPAPDPGGAASRANANAEANAGEPRFVIHEHHARRLHWDLRLERDGVLASWAVPKGLPEEPGENRFAAATEDHPLEYVDFHGEIPKGRYGAGEMKIWDSGTYECLKWEPRKVEVALHGRRVDARYALFAIGDSEPPAEWMIHRMDPPADAGREPMPQRIVPMLARAGSLPDDDTGWSYELKWDGVRAIAYSRPGELTLQSRNLNDVSARYPQLRALNRALSSHSAILDGEIVAFDADGRTSFQALQQGNAPTYMIFDLLWLDGHSLMDLPYERRRERLVELKLGGERWQTPENVLGQGRRLLELTMGQGIEGIVAKRLGSPYHPGLRTHEWIKIKGSASQELVIGGWMPGKAKRARTIGALLVGVHDADGALRYVGRVGSGLGERELERLQALLGGLARAASPFTAGAAPPRGAIFCEPRLVAQVRFSQWTASGSIRHPVYLGLRDDKRAEDVVREDAAPAQPATKRSRAAAGSSAAADTHATKRSRAVAGSRAAARTRPSIGAMRTGGAGASGATVTVDGRELKLSNLDKTMYPSVGFGKGDVIDYYAAIAPALLAHLDGRALTVTRWPDGVGGKSFFQKQSPAHRPDWVATARVRTRSKPIDYTLARDLPTLVWLANLAALELHVPLHRAQAMTRPTALVFDLDPGPPATVVQCCHVALALRGMFERVGVESLCKTSGSKGLQVYVPLNREDVTYEQSKPFARAVAQLLEQAEPELVVSRMTRARRAGRVLIDWSQNDVNKTTVCAYSLRANERPTVSTPLRWSEVRAALDAQDPTMLVFEAARVLARVAEEGDLFAPVLSLVQELPKI
jgi:bifunctional non-homologous end joining protein LigD